MSAETELRKTVFTQFFALKIEFPGLTVRFFTGRGQMTILGETYYGAGMAGEDGIWGDMEEIEGTVGEEAPRLRITLGGLQNSVVAEAREYTAQGSPVTIYDCLWNWNTMSAAETPEMVFYGFVDVATFELGQTSTISLDCASGLEYFFNANEGQDWNAQSHKNVWPGELGLDYCTTTTVSLPWGSEKDARPVQANAPRPSTPNYIPSSIGAGFMGGIRF